LSLPRLATGTRYLLLGGQSTYPLVFSLVFPI
jgi:hypothetical protein